MRAHEDVGMNIPAKLVHSLFKRIEKQPRITICLEDVVAGIASTHHMVARSGILNAHRSWHRDNKVKQQGLGKYILELLN